jgi:hypothetical protein
MSIYRKVVSVLLVLLTPTASAVALGDCPQQMTEMGGSHSDIAMMGMVSPHLSFTASQTNLCCLVSPADLAGPERASV